MPYVPSWSTCPRAIMSINVPTCQRCANYSTWRANIPMACQFLNLGCQRAKWRGNFLFRRGNVLKYVLDFQTFLLRNAKGNFYTLLLYKKFYIILDIIVIDMINIYEWYIKIVLYFISILHVILKKNVRNFCFFETFLFFS